ncbi:MAG: TIGR03619 family F420-dependent LLM class oxidoreductase [Candidatus Binatia bacterium]|nr:TIGR03619 family F420-dependent LLM class oxidoreductase [Candidatus Binatia bacterium]
MTGGSPASGAVQICPPGRLVCGMQLPIVAQSRVFAQPWEAGAGRDEIRRIAQACDRAGFFYLAVCDHIAIPRAQAEAMSTVWYDIFSTLGFLAACTERIRLLSYVLVLPYRHPLVAAKALCTLDALSGGRLIIGVGAGHLQGEFAALGVDFASRGRLLDEAIVALQAALTEEFPTHQGTYWRFADLGIRPRPVQRPRPPIWVGGSTPGALRRAARLGDGWLPQGVPAIGMEAALEYLRRERQRARGNEPLEVGINSPWLYVGEPPPELAPHCTSGSPEQIAALIRRLGALGVQHIGVRFRSRSCAELVEQIERFGSEVLPLLETASECDPAKR